MDSDNESKVEQVNIHSGTNAATTAAPQPPGPATAAPQPPRAHAPATVAPHPLMVNNQQQEFFRQMVKILKHQAPPQQQKIVIESRDYEETVEAAKLQTSMVRLMYATAVPNWDESTVKDVRLATFTQEFKNLLERSAMVQVTQLTNLFKMIFSTKPENKDDDGPLNRLMSLYVFPPKFTKGHLNATFQSNELELAAIYKSTSINPFHYAPNS
jgi:hypothetical protein